MSKHCLVYASRYHSWLFASDNVAASACAVRKRAKAEHAKKGAAVAHNGRVTGIIPTPDGLHWLTAGTDNRLRLWDTQHNYHLLVNYPQTFNSSMKVSAAVQMTADQPPFFMRH